MLLTRRTFLAASIGGAAGVSWPRLGSARTLDLAQAGSASIGSTRLADNLFLLTGAGANVIALSAADGVVLVDGGQADRSAALLAAVAALPGGGRVHTLFNTHWHPEQTGSNETLGKSGAAIIAHENTRLWLTTDVTWPWNGQRFTRLPQVAQPNKTFYTTGQLDRREGVPGDGVRYGYIPDAAHTDGDLYVYFPQQNVLAVGDALSNAGWPVVDWVTGGWIGGIVGGLQRISTIGNDKTVLVPGRGPVMTIAELKTQYDMYGALYDRLSKLLNSGRGPTEAVEAKPAKEFEAKMGNADEFVRRAFESLWAYVTPDA